MNTLTFIMDHLKEVFSIILSYAPTVVYMAVALIVGTLLARTVAKHAATMLKNLHVDKFSHTIGLSRVLETGGIKRGVSDIIAGVFGWGIMITTLVIALSYAGVNVIGALTDPVTTYVPHVIVAVLGLMVAMFLAYIIAVFIRVVAANTDMPKPELLATLTKWAIIGHAFYGFLTHIGLGVLFTGTYMTIMITALALALGLAFGLGGREHASKYLDKVLKQ